MHRRRGGRRLAGGPLARHGYPRREQAALVVLVLHRNPHRNRFQTLETGGRLKVGALFAAVQLGIALGASPAEIEIRGKRRRAIETPRCRDVLHQSRKPGAGDVQGRTRPLGPGTVLAEAFALAVRVHIPVLSVFTIAIHGEGSLRIQRDYRDVKMGRL